MLGHTAHEGSFQACPPMRAHNDRIAMLVPGRSNDFGRRFSLNQQVFNIYIRPRWTKSSQHIPQMVLVFLGATLRRQLFVLHLRVIHMKDKQARLVIFGQRTGQIKGAFSMLRKVRGLKNRVDFP